MSKPIEAAPAVLERQPMPALPLSEPFAFRTSIVTLPFGSEEKLDQLKKWLADQDIVYEVDESGNRIVLTTGFLPDEGVPVDKQEEEFHNLVKSLGLSVSTKGSQNINTILASAKGADEATLRTVAGLLSKAIKADLPRFKDEKDRAELDAIANGLEKIHTNSPDLKDSDPPKDAINTIMCAVYNVYDKAGVQIEAVDFPVDAFPPAKKDEEPGDEAVPAPPKEPKGDEAVPPVVPAPAPAKSQSAFDKTDQIAITDDLVAKKDKETGKLTISDAEGKEAFSFDVDPFGEDIPSIIKFLAEVAKLTGDVKKLTHETKKIKDESEAQAKKTQDETSAREAEFASLQKETAALKSSRREDAIVHAKQVQELQTKVASEQARTALVEHTWKVRELVGRMVRAGALRVQASDVEPFMKQGMAVFDARKAAAQELVSKQTTHLLAMTADQLRAFAEKTLSKQASNATPEAGFQLHGTGSGSHWATAGRTEQEELDFIFSKMGLGGAQA